MAAVAPERKANMEQNDKPNGSGGRTAVASGEEIERRAREILARMSLEEKIHAMSGDAPFWQGMSEMIGEGYNLRPIVAGENRRLGLLGLRFGDGPRGVVLGSSTCFPVSMARGAAWDPHLEERIGDAIGVELRSQGANLFGGVCVNLLRHPAWGRAQETYGEDPHHLGEMGAALVRGVQRHAMACVKHFALNSIENARFKVNVIVSDRALHEVYLPHFKRCVKEGAASVMSAYNKVNGEFCGQNRRLLTEILREEWGFEGFVISDFIFGLREAKLGVLAGMDVEMPFSNLYSRHLPDLLESGEVSYEAVDESALRTIRQQLRFEDVGEPERYSIEAVASEEHRALAREAAQKSIVLLKNDPIEDIPLLPLSRNVGQVAVIGRLARIPNTGDGGSSMVRPPEVVTPLEGLQATLGTKIMYEEGEDPQAAARLAGESDVAVVVVGYTHEEEGEFIDFSENPEMLEVFPPAEEGDLAERLRRELVVPEGQGRGGDRESLRLKPADEELIKAVASANRHTVVVMMGGSAVVTEDWRSAVPAILMLWYPGMEGGHALADLLLGKVNPSGKLPCVFPKSEDDLPPFDKDAGEIEYDLFHGYRLLERTGVEPAFPFGFGLSYTTFEYQNLTLESTKINGDGVLRVSAEITNAGPRTGEEIVQVYVGASNSSIERAIKELKAFRRIWLEPAGFKRVTLDIPVSNLAHYDENASRFVVEPGDYEVVVARNSLDENALRAEFRVVAG
jgi:beta-glucosidase